MSVASRWLEWFEYRISGGSTPVEVVASEDPQRELVADDRVHRSLQEHLPCSDSRIGARPVGREHPVRLRLRVLLRRPRHQRPPAPAEPFRHRLELVRVRRSSGAPHTTSAIMIGGAWK